ncbi:MAG: hypothetical protein HC861_02505, partial [Rhodospirillaceae bacterium]|nr:hypothetical protein [Rhodospirillaceae bacterium]
MEEATGASLLGPFFRENTPRFESGAQIARDLKGGAEVVLYGKVTNAKGEPLPNALVTVWQTAADGRYDIQNSIEEIDCRGIFRTDANGNYVIRTVRPLGYFIPLDGPVGQMVMAQKRHGKRPAHIHFLISAVGHRELVTALYLNVLVVATCGLVYELLAGALGSYLLGDSVTQFSLVIGLYLSAMGAGAWLSRQLERDLAQRFLDVELAVAVVGGLAVPVLFFAFGTVEHFQLLLLSFVFAVGVLVGLEIPLLMRLLEGQLQFKDLVSRVLTFDYIGALVAALLFPLLLVPKLGLVRTSLLMGIANALVALWGSYLLPLGARNRWSLRARAALVIVGLAVGVWQADALTSRAEETMYTDPVVYSKTSSYQRIVVTRGRAGFQLFLNGNLQFDSRDEYRYHEALVHPAFAAFDGEAKRVLVLGGGDGLALEILHGGLLEHEVLEVAVVDVDAADLEEALGAQRVLEDREHRERIAAFPLRRHPHDVAGEPAQERRDRVRPQRRHHEAAGLARRDRLAAGAVDDFEKVEIGERNHRAKPVALDRGHGPLGHAEAVVDGRAPASRELRALGLCERLGADQQLRDARRGEVDAARLGDVGE